MPNTIFSSEGALLFIMVATVALGFWLQRFKVFKTLGPALTVIAHRLAEGEAQRCRDQEDRQHLHEVGQRCGVLKRM